jgi:hypothetical protein
VSKLFDGYAGFVQADAKSVFDILYRPPKERDHVDDDHVDRVACREVACCAHARTKFWEVAVATQDVVAREALARIMRMFRRQRVEESAAGRSQDTSRSPPPRARGVVL